MYLSYTKCHYQTPYIQILQGCDSNDGLPGCPGPAGPPGRECPNGKKGDRGELGPFGARNGGMVFTRWGCTTCPTTNDTEILCKGKAAGSDHLEHGGGANYICLPDESEFLIHLVYLICSPTSMELNIKLIKTVTLDFTS